LLGYLKKGLNESLYIIRYTMKTVSIKTFSKLTKKDTITLASRRDLHIKNNYLNDVDDKSSVKNSAMEDDDEEHLDEEQINHAIYKDIDINEQMIFDPFNSKNVEITEEYVQSILKKYGVPTKIHNINLYKRAFVHKSYVKRAFLDNEKNNITIVDKPDGCLGLKTKSNERLEFLGDGVLECITKYYLYRRFPKANEGFMTEKKIALVKNENIGKLAYDMGINKYYIISKNAEEKKIRTNHKRLGCLFEAFIGALFLDFNKVEVNDEEGWFKNVFVTGPGFHNAQIFIENIFEQHVNWDKIIQDDDNYKNILQVNIQKEFKTTPTYMIINEDDDGYHMGVYLAINIPIQDIKPENAIQMKGNIEFDKIHDHIEKHDKILLIISTSTHKIKKKAEQDACKKAIERIL